MEKTKSKKIISRISKNFYFVSFVLIIITFAFFQNFLYSAVVLLSCILSGLSFYILIISVDKLINDSISKSKFFFITVLKILFIGMIFIIFSKIDEKFSILFILGFSSVIISIMIEGFYLFVRSLFNGRA